MLYNMQASLRNQVTTLLCEKQLLQSQGALPYKKKINNLKEKLDIIEAVLKM